MAVRWNRKVIEIKEEINQFPSFSQFVKFLTREVKIACNSVTSLQALKLCEVENPKFQKHQSFVAKTLTTSTSGKTCHNMHFLSEDWTHCAQMQEAYGKISFRLNKICSS